MRRPKRILLLLGGGLMAFLALLVCLQLALPLFVNGELVRKKVVDEIQRAGGFDARFENLGLSIIPGPQIIARGVGISKQGSFTGTIRSLSISPQLLPLFVGNFKIARIKAVMPKIAVRIPGETPKEDTQPYSLSVDGIRKEIDLLRASFRSRASDIVIEVQDGILSIVANGGSNLLCNGIFASASFLQGRAEWNIQAKSNLWEKFSSQGRLNPDNLKSEGRLKITGLKPKEPTESLFPYSRFQVDEAVADLDISFRSEGPEALDAEITGSAPVFDFAYNQEKLSLKGVKLTGSIKKSGNKLDLTLKGLDLSSPRLGLTGNLLTDYSNSSQSLYLEGRDIDVSSVRSMVLSLLGNNSTVEKIFDVVRGGRVPLISFSSRGDSLRDLGKPDNFVLKGDILDGKIFIPSVELELEETCGAVTISHGVLEGRNLKTRTGNTRGSNGILDLGLRRDAAGDAPFHLDVAVDADLSELPPVLRRTVKNAAFLKELGFIKELGGRARGRLILGETLSSVGTKVEADEFTLFSQYERVPFPLEIEGKSLTYNGKTVSISTAGVKAGKSALTCFTALFDWGDNPRIAVESKEPGAIFLDEIYSWLRSYSAVKKALEDLESIKGTFLSTELSLNGPLFDPADWQIRVKGTPETMAIGSAFIQGPLTVKTGELEATKQRISLSNCIVENLDASLKVTGNIDIGKDAAVDLSFDGRFGPESYQQVCELFQLPPGVKIRSPFSANKNRFAWNSGGRIAYSGDIAVEGGPWLAMSINRTADEISVEDFSIKDEISNATLSVKIGKNKPHLTFQGTLNSKTLDRLLAENHVLSGTATGKFDADLNLEALLRSAFTGDLHLEGLQIPRKSKSTLFIESASLEGRENKLFLKPAILNVDSSRITLDGSVEARGEALQLDIDLSADSLDWEKLSAQLNDSGEEQSKSASDENAPGHSRDTLLTSLQGVIRVKAARFILDKYSWSPISGIVTLQGDNVGVEISEASLCGISTSGNVLVAREGITFDIKPSARELALDPVLKCLLNKEHFMDGTFNLSGRLRGENTGQALSKSVQGIIEFDAKAGRIYGSKIVSKILALLNVTEIYRGRLPDLVNEGCAYDTMNAKGIIRDGKLVVEETTIDGRCMKMFWTGEVDLATQKLELTVLVAPLRTVDSIVNLIPLVGDMLNGSLLMVPFRVHGDISNPEVTPLAPSSVGSQLKDMMKNILKAPIKLFQPLW